MDIKIITSDDEVEIIETITQTLGNNGAYVLCTPDTWLSINGFFVPGYAATTLGV